MGIPNSVLPVGLTKVLWASISLLTQAGWIWQRYSSPLKSGRGCLGAIEFMRSSKSTHFAHFAPSFVAGPSPDILFWLLGRWILEKIFLRYLPLRAKWIRRSVGFLWSWILNHLLTVCTVLPRDFLCC